MTFDILKCRMDEAAIRSPEEEATLANVQSSYEYLYYKGKFVLHDMDASWTMCAGYLDYFCNEYARSGECVLAIRKILESKLVVAVQHTLNVLEGCIEQCDRDCIAPTINKYKDGREVFEAVSDEGLIDAYNFIVNELEAAHLYAQNHSEFRRDHTFKRRLADILRYIREYEKQLKRLVPYTLSYRENLKRRYPIIRFVRKGDTT